MYCIIIVISKCVTLQRKSSQEKVILTIETYQYVSYIYIYIYIKRNLLKMIWIHINETSNTLFQYNVQEIHLVSKPC